MSRRRAQREEAKAEFLRANPHLPDHETTVEIEQRVNDGIVSLQSPVFRVNFEQDGTESGSAVFTQDLSLSPVSMAAKTVEGPHFSLSTNTPLGFFFTEDGTSVIDPEFTRLTGPSWDSTTSGDDIMSLEIFEQNNEFFASLPSPTPVDTKGGKSVEFDVQATGAGGVTVTLLDDDGTILIERMFETTTNDEQNFSVEVEAPQGVFFDEAQIQAIGDTEFTVTGLSFTTNFEMDFMQIA